MAKYMAKDKEDKSLAEDVKDVNMNYKSGQEGVQGMPQVDENKKKEMEEIKEKLQTLKDKILEKYKFVFAMGILPPKASKKIVEEERVPKEEAEKKPIHLAIVIPEEKFKKIKEIKAGMVELAKDMGPKVWLHIKTPVDMWNFCLDSKFEMVSAYSMAYPLYDKKKFLETLRLAEIHKSLVLNKFEKYVTSYVLGGSFITGKAKKTSDIDIYIIIDDTDVKRMPRLHLKEKLRGIIYQYEAEARELAGTDVHLHIQTYILTDFWENVKDANPVIFTFIRDGIPLYDSGTFMPWKLLLGMGKLKPSPEAIDKFMSMGDQVSDMVKKNLRDVVIKDIYWGILTPAQALLMLYGLPPPKTSNAPKIFLDTFVKKEGILEKKYSDILKRIVKAYKDFEHGKVKEFTGKQVDGFLQDAEDFLSRMKDLRKQIEERSQKKTLEDVHNGIFEILKNIFNKKQDKALIKKFKEELVDKGQMSKQDLKTLKKVSESKNKDIEVNFDKNKKKNKEKNKNKIKRHEVEKLRKDANVLLNRLIEYNQRKELIGLQKSGMRLKTEDKEYELVVGEDTFLIDEGQVKKIDPGKGLVNSDNEEFNKALDKQKGKKEVKINPEIFSILKKEIGSFEVVL